jgi:transposase
LLDAGLSIRKVAAFVKISPNRILHRKKRWEKERFNALADKPRSGRKVKLTERQMTEILQMLKGYSNPPPLHYFAQAFGEEQRLGAVQFGAMVHACH